ncbi:MAG: DUF427 domain-containing protein [Alphaproteobacteria bacterium]|nr:DUF427 domain-containing protein [Alphaproteobacteria bacterium]
MAKAVWKNKILAESDTFEVVEGNIYFPADALNREFFSESDHQSNCPWKGMAHYYLVTVDGEENPDAAWYYPDPKRAAENIRDHVAFWRGVEVSQ